MYNNYCGINRGDVLCQKTLSKSVSDLLIRLEIQRFEKGNLNHGLELKELGVHLKTISKELQMPYRGLSKLLREHKNKQEITTHRKNKDTQLKLLNSINDMLLKHGVPNVEYTVVKVDYGISITFKDDFDIKF